MMKTISAAVAGVLLFAGAAESAAAQTAPAPSDDTTEVIVTGQAPEVIDKIDRRSYDVTKDPQADSGLITDILRKLPSVTVSNTGEVALRGAGVTILIDGHVPSEGNDAIRSLPSSRVARIEIMTNPSAQYAPDGTGGIINIITRRHAPMRLSGDVNAQTDSRNRRNAALALTLDSGRLSLAGQAFADHFQDASWLHFHQEALNAAGDGHDTSDRQDRSRYSADNATASLGATWKLTARGNVTLKGSYGNYTSVSSGLSTYSGTDMFDEESAGKFGSRNSDVQAQYDFHGGDGEYLSLLTEHSGYDNSQVSDYDRGEGGRNLTFNATTGGADRFQGDYERRIGPNLLTTGFSLDRTFIAQASGFAGSGAFAPLADYAYTFKGARTISAVYATWQTPLRGWTVMPGLRAEYQRLDLPGGVHAGNLGWYPTFHASRMLDDKRRLKLSYSKRIFRPSLSDYDPTVRYFGAMSLFAGNPELKPQVTESWEAGYGYLNKDFSFDASFYSRRTRGSFSAYTEVTAGGLLFLTTVNSGRSQDIGVELSASGPLGRRLTYKLNGNLFHNEMPYTGEDEAATHSQVAWSGNAMLEYAAVNGDRWQLNASGFSRTLTIQGYVSGFVTLDASYRHALTDRLSLVVTASDIFNSIVTRTVVDTPALKTVSEGRPNQQAVRIALAWKFGAAPE